MAQHCSASHTQHPQSADGIYGSSRNAGGKPVTLYQSRTAVTTPARLDGELVISLWPTFHSKPLGRLRFAAGASQAVNKRSTIVLSVSWLAGERCAQGGFSLDPLAATVGAPVGRKAAEQPRSMPFREFPPYRWLPLMRDIPRLVSRTPSSAASRPPPFSCWRNGQLPRGRYHTSTKQRSMRVPQACHWLKLVVAQACHWLLRALGAENRRV